MERLPDVQERIGELEGKGWTVAAIADELGYSSKTVYRWRNGSHPPENPGLVIMGLDRLMKRRRIPKQKRY